MNDIYKILERNLITERATRLKAHANQYVLKVNRDANKQQIRHAVESLFKVKVEAIQTMRVPGKTKRMGSGRPGVRSEWKKAIVRLVAGQEIKMLDEKA